MIPGMRSWWLRAGAWAYRQRASVRAAMILYVAGLTERHWSSTSRD
jgi:hypothetical protein